MNQYESQAIREQFLASGFREAGSCDKPDICIINTCSVTNHAQAKGRNYINRLRSRYPDTTLVATGCTVNYKSESIDGKVDFLIKNEEKYSLVNMLTSSEPHSLRGLVKERKENGDSGISYFANRTRAFLKIQDGCDEFCSYCILPYVRGRSKSRDFDEIIKEAKRLVDNKYREIVLVGIHLGDYGKDIDVQDALVELLKELEKIPRLSRIRLSSLEPQDIKDPLIERIAGSQKICRHLHIPLQSGDNIILKQMNRRYKYEEYRNLLNRIAFNIPDIVFTTDIIVGFPSETEEQFLNSCRAVKELGFIKVHIFPYSLRPGTDAAKFPGKISNKDIKKRVRILQKTASDISFKEKEKKIGTLQEVLIEKPGINSIGYTHTPKSLVCGYTSGYIPVKIEGSTVPNSLVNVKITGIEGEYLIGAGN